MGQQENELEFFQLRIERGEALSDQATEIVQKMIASAAKKAETIQTQVVIKSGLFISFFVKFSA